METKRQVSRLEGHLDKVNGIAFAPEGDLLVSGGSDFTVRFWPLDSGGKLKEGFELKSNFPLSSQLGTHCRIQSRR